MNPSGAACLIGDGKGRILVAEPTYQQAWVLPGGAIEPGESPAAAARREVHEELGLDLDPGRLLCVDYRTERDAYRFLFDGGVLTPEQAAAIRLGPAELRSWRFASVDEAMELLSPYEARRVEWGIRQLAVEGALYLEDQQPHPRAPQGLHPRLLPYARRSRTPAGSAEQQQLAAFQAGVLEIPSQRMAEIAAQLRAEMVRRDA